MLKIRLNRKYDNFKFMLIDAHAHLNFNAYKEDVDEVIKECLENEIWIINVGSQYTTSRRAVRISQKYKTGVYASIGLHPLHLETKLVKLKEDPQEVEFETREEEFDYQKYKDLTLPGFDEKGKIKAIGEIGLDYYYKPKSKEKLRIFKEKQRTALDQQIILAKELNLPIIFHCRAAHNDLIEVLKSEMNSKLRGVIHCFTEDWEKAKEYLDLGFYLGFNALIFKLNLDEIIKKIPEERILLETDCPYLSPPGYPKKRNDPLSLNYIVQKIAEIKNVSYQKIAEITTENAKRLFGLKT